MNIRIIAATMIIITAPLPVAAQQDTTDSDASAPQPEDRLKTLGGQLLQELFTRVTTRKTQIPPDIARDSTNDPYAEPIAEPSPEPIAETETEIDVMNEDAAAASETAPPASPEKLYLRSQRRAKQPAMARPQ